MHVQVLVSSHQQGSCFEVQIRTSFMCPWPLAAFCWLSEGAAADVPPGHLATYVLEHGLLLGISLTSTWLVLHVSMYSLSIHLFKKYWYADASPPCHCHSACQNALQLSGAKTHCSRLIHSPDVVDSPVAYWFCSSCSCFGQGVECSLAPSGSSRVSSPTSQLPQPAM